MDYFSVKKLENLQPGGGGAAGLTVQYRASVWVKAVVPPPPRLSALLR